MCKNKSNHRDFYGQLLVVFNLDSFSNEFIQPLDSGKVLIHHKIYTSSERIHITVLEISIFGTKGNENTPSTLYKATAYKATTKYKATAYKATTNHGFVYEKDISGTINNIFFSKDTKFIRQPITFDDILSFENRTESEDNLLKLKAGKYYEDLVFIYRILTEYIREIYK